MQEESCSESRCELRVTGCGGTLEGLEVGKMGTEEDEKGENNLRFSYLHILLTS